MEVAGVEWELRIDVLGQIPEDRSGLSIRERRMRPHGFSGLHAHPLAEAAFIHIDPLAMPVCAGPDGGSVQIPHPFSYMILKLFAFEDRKDDDRVDRGRHHAFDLYRIVAMLTRTAGNQDRS